MARQILNSKDKNNIIMAGVLISTIAITVIFVKISRTLPLLYLFAALELVEIFFTVPTVCSNYYRLYGMSAGTVKYVPFFNVIAVFERPIAIATIVLAMTTGVLGYLSVGPMFWVTANNVDFFSDVQYRSLGWAIISFILLSLVVGIGYISVYQEVLEMKEEFTGGTASKAEFANFILLLLPISRGFSLFNLSHTMKMLLAAGYEYGKDYTELEIKEEE